MKLYFESIESGEAVHGYTRATIENHIAEITDEAAIKYWCETLAQATPVIEVPATPTAVPTKRIWPPKDDGTSTSPQKDYEVTA